MRQWFRKAIANWLRSKYLDTIICPTPYTVRVSTDGKHAYLQGNSEGEGVRLWYFLDECHEVYSDLHDLSIIAFYKEAGGSTKLHPWSSAEGVNHRNVQE